MITKINSTYYIIENSIIYYFSGFTPLGVKLKIFKEVFLWKTTQKAQDF